MRARLKTSKTNLTGKQRKPHTPPEPPTWQRKMALPIEFNLELPPSTNHLYRRGRRPGTAYLDPTYKAWKDLAVWEIRQQIPEGLRLPIFPPTMLVSVIIHAWMEANRDIDNLLKATFDAGTAAELWADDRQIRRQFATCSQPDEHNRRRLALYVTDWPISWFRTL